MIFSGKTTYRSGDRPDPGIGPIPDEDVRHLRQGWRTSRAKMAHIPTRHRADPRRGKTRKIERKTEVADNQRKRPEKSGSDNVQPNAS